MPYAKEKFLETHLPDNIVNFTARPLATSLTLTSYPVKFPILQYV